MHVSPAKNELAVREATLSYIDACSIDESWIALSSSSLDSPIRILYFPCSFTCPVWFTSPF